MRSLAVIPALALGLAACGEQLSEPDATAAPMLSVQDLDASTCAARAPTFFVEPAVFPASVDPNLDHGWQNAVGNSFDELDLDAGFPDRSDVDRLISGSLVIDVGLAGIGGPAPTGKMFFGNYPSGDGSYGTVWGGALINLYGGWGNQYARGQLTLEFSRPVAGFGAWVFDDAGSTEQSFRLIATDTDRATTVSPVLESGNGDRHWVEGFIGVVSPVGIEAVAIEVLDEFGRAVVFELDHLQVSPHPAPVTATEWAAATREAIAGLYCTGGLDLENANGLLAKLDAVDKSLANDRPSAPNQLGAFINQVEAFVLAEILTSQLGQALIDAARSAIEAIG